jgi:hypothetical protein
MASSYFVLMAAQPKTQITAANAGLSEHFVRVSHHSLPVKTTNAVGGRVCDAMQPGLPKRARLPSFRVTDFKT